MAIQQDIEQLSIAIDSARIGFFNQFEYGNLGLINENHNNTYPILHLLPPTSTFPDPYKNDERLSCTFHCYEVVQRIADGGVVGVSSQTTMLEKTHDKLLEQFKGTMQALMLGNEHLWIMKTPWTITRVNEEFNDGLCGIIVTCDIEKFTHCMLYNS